MWWDGHTTEWFLWEAFGLLGQVLFFSRLLVQWAATEKERHPVIPTSYWYLSLGGAVILFVYAFHRQSLVFLLPQVVGLVFYSRMLLLELRHRRLQALRTEAGFDAPDFPWPRVSVIVPVHNEEKTIAKTLESLLAQDYPRERLEIIAALNGCTDASEEIVRTYPVTLASSEKAGMSFGKNLGAREATGEILVFVDADTTLPAHAVRRIVESMHHTTPCVAALPGRPEHGGPVVRVCFALANRYARRKRVLSIGPMMAVHRDLFDAVNGLDETLPQGTSSDFLLRCQQAGGTYVFVDDVYATTSIRRFTAQRFGIVRQLLSWRRNHVALGTNRHDEIRERPYSVYR